MSIGPKRGLAGASRSRAGWRTRRLSFLSYPDFESDPHPALRHAITIDLAMGKARHTDYAGNANPPILHRKEAFLPAGHPLWATFRALTEAEEAAGLYQETATIGFRLNWEKLLADKGLEIQGHSLRRATASAGCGPAFAEAMARQGVAGPGDCHLTLNPSPPVAEREAKMVVERHKTALTRYDLSKPVESLLEFGVLRQGTSFFDYGCGQGSDVRELQVLGYKASGWDPVLTPDGLKRAADVVNCGYVLNVIEDPAERVETLVDAFRHAGRLLVVSGLISETVDTSKARRFADGVLTRSNTFQKYFEQQELQQFIEDALDTTAVPVALGVFYVFRNPAEQQDFLSARSRRADWTQISARLGLGRPAEPVAGSL